MILAVSHLAKAYGEKPILEDITFKIEEKEKIGVVGVNGAGKTTLFKLITGELTADSGQVIKPNEVKIGYLQQMLAMQEERTVKEELLSSFAAVLALENKLRQKETEMAHLSGEHLQKAMEEYAQMSLQFELQQGYEYETLVKNMLLSLGFAGSKENLPVAALSGGEKERLAFGKLLFSRADLLLLDEPTNHLDMQGVEFLENYIKTYAGAVLLISHDRYFLNQTTQKTLEICHGKSTVYSGSYDVFAQKKQAQREADYKAYVLQQKEIKRQEAIIRQLQSYNREKSIIKAESRKKMLDKMEKKAAPEDLPASMRMQLEPQQVSGEDVLRLNDLGKSFPDKTLFSQVNLWLRRGEKLAVIGPNGCGKSTLLKMLHGEIEPDCGSIHWGARVQTAYFDQEHRNLHGEKTLFDEIYDENPHLPVQKIYATLAAFVFTGDKVFQRVDSLSSGERGRLLLAKLMLSNANCLLLDEPTNHLDIESKEILEEALQQYTGTLFMVSHDRYFMNKVAQQIGELGPDGLQRYAGNYDEYLRQKKARGESPKENPGGKGKKAVWVGMATNCPSSGKERAQNGVAQKEGLAPSQKSQPQGGAGLSQGAVAKADGASTMDRPEDYFARKQKQQEARKLKNKLQKIEEQITLWEKQLAELEEKLNDPQIARDPEKAALFYTQKCQQEEELLQLYAQWEELQS